MKPLRRLFVICCLLLPVWLHAQSYDFSHHQVEGGLSNNAVLCSLMDKNGFMWFGTIDGLNRFDGYTFKIFRKDSSKTGSIGDNTIFSLYEDPDGFLWVGTQRGLYQFHFDTESFTPFKPSAASPIRCMLKDADKNFWFIAGLNLFRRAPSGAVKSYVGEFEATSLCIADGKLWISTPQGFLKRYNSADGTFNTYNVFNEKIPAPSHWIEKIYTDISGNLIIGTSNQGVKMFNTQSALYVNLLTRNADGTDIFARDFIRASPHEIWMATESGIFVYSEETHRFTNLRKQYNNPYAISDNAVYTFCKDRDGGIWAGTYFGGLNYYSPQYANFEKMFPKTGENSISGNAVREICKDTRGNLWIGTEDNGLNKLNTKTKRFTNYRPGDGHSGLINSNIHGLLAVGDELWIGTFEHGLDVMDLRTEKVVRHYIAGAAVNQFKSNFIDCMLKTSDGNILIGTAKGLYRYNRASDDFTLINQVPADAFYTVLMEDDKHNIWAGTFRDGLYHFNLKTVPQDPAKKANAMPGDLSINRITDLLLSTDHQIWITTEAGLYRFTPGNKQLSRYTAKDGLPADLLLSVLQDHAKQLWISTTKGLARFNPLNGKVNVYTRANGLLNDQFNYSSAFRDDDGKMYFGSVKGLIDFNPANFVANNTIAPIYITGFQVNNRELEVGLNNSPLKKSIILADHIVLDHQSSSFSIDFSSLSYAAPRALKYAYKMDGLDDQWTYIKSNRKVYFTELAPGDYTFTVKSTNNNNIWNPNTASLTIRIEPPLWKSALAYFVYSTTLIIAVIVSLLRYKRRLETKHQQQREIFEREKEKEIYQAKIEFFTNVAHEIRTPLTLIKAPMSKVIKRIEQVPEIAKNLRTMEKNTDRLLALTNQLLDFRSTETKGFSLNFVKIELNDFLSALWASFQPEADRLVIDYRFIAPKKTGFAYVDQEAVTKIVSNLLDNALKYGRGKVEIELLPFGVNDSYFKLEVRSNGKPIPAEHYHLVFEPFSRLGDHQKHSGTGIGMAISRSLAELHNGKLEICDYGNEFNTFVLTLPVHQFFEFNLNSVWKKH